MTFTKTTLLLVLLFFVSILFSSFFINNFYEDRYVINEFGDRYIYAQRGMWYINEKTPYSEVFSEYPQIATYFFALPYIIQKLTNAETAPQIMYAYTTIFSLLMMVFATASIFLIYKLRVDKKYLSLLMLLPASLYFIHNRYDIIPAFLSLLSLYLLQKKKFFWATAILAIGVMTKWYLVILLPIYLTYYFWQTKKINWKMIIVFTLTTIIIIMPTILTAGFDGFLVPYIFHLTRNFNLESTFFILYYVFEQIGNIYIDSNAMLTFFFLMQFFIAPLALTSKIKTFEKVIKWSLLSILFFVFFAKFYSPQWILWFSPLVIILIKNKRDVLWLILFDLTTYIYFPILYYTITEISIIYLLTIIFRTFLFIKLILPLLLELLNDNLILSYFKKKLIPKTVSN
ncbi:hypothetical protein KKA15_03025 [Patescibacteria group bacterium]|nr:hypothetical protein [Patescibacteria group bacterium]